MKRSFHSTIGLMSIALAGGATCCVPDIAELLDESAYTSKDGTYAVAYRDSSFFDPERLRPVPVRVYYPPGTEGPWPLIVISHGLGSSREAYTYLGRAWTAAGYVCVHPTHLGSGVDLLESENLPLETIFEAVDDAANLELRPGDISFVLDRLEQDATFGPLIDWDNIGVAGHSFGAHTALAMIGMRVDLPLRPNQDFSDARIKAAVALSPQGPGIMGLDSDAWDWITVPSLSLMGTMDIEIWTPNPLLRRIPYDRTPGRDQYLVTINGAGHQTYLDFGFWLPRTPERETNHAYILAATTAFFDAHLKKDAAAQAWLAGGKIELMSLGKCRLECKRITPVGEGAAELLDGVHRTHGIQ